MAEKSEGEISDSGEEGEVSVPSPKKLKRSSKVKWGAEINPPRENGRETRRKKRKRMKSESNMLKKRERSSRDNSMCGSLISSLANTILSSDQVSILTQLAGLVSPSSPLTHSPPSLLSPSSATPDSEPPQSPEVTEVMNSALSTRDLQTLKTAKLKGIIFHLLLGLPWLPGPIDGLTELYKRPVAILWLSMVSADLFLNSPEAFGGLRSLTPHVQFQLEHPGSAHYAKMGLESLMFLSSSEEKNIRQERGGGGGGRGGGGGGGVCLKRTHCLLNMDTMKENDFPIPSSHPHSPASKSHPPQSGGVNDYLRLSPEWPASVKDDEVNEYPMFAVDCEMVQTREGLELARVSVVDEGLVCVYDKFVKPDNPVLDYKTQYSGVTKETLKNTTTTLRDVQSDLRHLLPSHCILIGHSLENDLHVLRLSHPYVIDTSCLFLSSGNCQYKPKLRALAKKLLGVEIQVRSDGHSSIQDASTCMKLVLKKLRDGRQACLEGASMLAAIASVNHSVAMVDRPSIINLFGVNTTRYPVASDGDAVTEARVALAHHDLTFVQLHSYEEYLKTAKSRQCDHDSQRVLRQLCAEVLEIAESCQSGTLVMVVCGSSDIREAKALQQREQRERLKEVVAVARTGLATAFISS